MPISKGMKSKLTRIRNEIVEVSLTPRDTNWQLMLDALLAGEKQVEVTLRHEAGEFTDVYDQADMAEYLDSLVYVEIAPFVREQNAENYNRLLNAFFAAVIYYTALKKCQKEPEDFHADYILTLIMTIMYCDHDTQRLMVEAYAYYRQSESGQEDARTKHFTYPKTLLHLLIHMLNQRPELGLKEADFFELGEVESCYAAALTQLGTEDDELFEQVIMDLCDYHLKNSKDNYFLEFNNTRWQYWPVEILYLLKERQALGFSIEHLTHPLLDEFMPYFLNPFEMSERNQLALKQVLAN